MAPASGQTRNAQQQQQQQPLAPRAVATNNNVENKHALSADGGWLPPSLDAGCLQAAVDASPELRELLKERGIAPDVAPAADLGKTLLDLRGDVERDLCIFAGALRFLDEQRAALALDRSRCTVCARPFTSAPQADTCRQELEAKMSATEEARDEADVVRRWQLCKLALEAAQHQHQHQQPPCSPLASPLSPAASGDGDAMDENEGDADCAMMAAAELNESTQHQHQQALSRAAAPSPPSTVSLPSSPTMASSSLTAHRPEEPALDELCVRVATHMRCGALTELRNQKAENLQDQRCFGCLRCFTGPELAEYLRAVDRRAFVMSERLPLGSPDTA